MKKTKLLIKLPPLLCIIFLLCSLPFLSVSADETEGDYTYIVTDGAATITKASASLSGHVDIPSILGGCPVTAIRYNAFENNPNLTSVNIPYGVTTIGSFAFWKCYNLTEVTIPDSVVSIGNYAFRYDGLTSVDIPGSVKTIGSGAFLDCNDLAEVTLPEGIETIADSAFQNTGIIEITIPDSITTITHSMLSGCKKLTRVTLGKNVETIEFNAFTNSSSLAEFTITSSVTSIGDTAFARTALKEIVIPENVTNLGKNVFEECTSLTSATIEARLTALPYMLFFRCSSLTDVTYPDSVTTLEDKVFSYSGFETYTLPGHVTSIGGSLFRYCSNLTSFKIPSGITAIPDSMFAFDRKLKEVTIPASVKSVDNTAFYFCEALTDVYFIGTEEEWKAIKIGTSNDPLKKATVHYIEEETEHLWGEWTITEMPTQTDKGKAERKCEYNSDHKESVDIPALSDTDVWTAGNRVEPTCENEGSQEYTSEYGTVTEILNATGHSWGGWTITAEPTQTTGGTAERKCDNDPNHVDSKDIPALTDTNVWTAGSRVEPTCENEGSQEYTSEYGTVTETLDATGHSWGGWTITAEPTQTTGGTAERKCDNDPNHVDSKDIPALNDSNVWTAGSRVEPTCENEGSQEYTSEYGTVTETLDATGHSWGGWTITAKPTQTTGGTAERKCDNDADHVDSKDIPALTDTNVWTAGSRIEPSCENEGSQEYTSEYGTVTETLNATGHSWGGWTITAKPTQTTGGTAERKCANDADHVDSTAIPALSDIDVWTAGNRVEPSCENEGSQEYNSEYGTVTEILNATGHSWGGWTITAEPTQTTDGTAERKCDNDTDHVDSKDIPALSDSNVWTAGNRVEPSCENKGSQEYTSEYGTVTETLEATGHSWGEWTITAEPTQTTGGTAERKCANDADHVDSKDIPALNDSNVWTAGKRVDPSCENEGSQEYTSEYGTVTEILNATGHSWGGWTITAEPTQTTGGTAERKCDNDPDHVDSKDIPALTDTNVWTAGSRVEPSCENEGSQEYNSVYGTVTETLNATGHSWGEWVTTKEPTYTEPGERQRICKNDNSHADVETIPTLPAPEAYAVEYSDGKAVVTVPEEGICTVIFAAYKDGALIYYEWLEIYYDQPGEYTVAPTAFEHDGADLVKVMLWSTLGEIRPLCPASEK